MSRIESVVFVSKLSLCMIEKDYPLQYIDGVPHLYLSSKDTLLNHFMYKHKGYKPVALTSKDYGEVKLVVNAKIHIPNSADVAYYLYLIHKEEIMKAVLNFVEMFKTENSRGTEKAFKKVYSDFNLNEDIYSYESLSREWRRWLSKFEEKKAKTAFYHDQKTTKKAVFNDRDISAFWAKIVPCIVDELFYKNGKFGYILYLQLKAYLYYKLGKYTQTELAHYFNTTRCGAQHRIRAGKSLVETNPVINKALKSILPIEL